MATIDLRGMSDSDGFVIYFGGRPNEVDSYTFANALVAVADAFREINAQVNTGTSLEVRLEALSEGSFKARLKGAPKSIAGLFGSLGRNVILPILLAFIYDEWKGEESITVNTDEVIIQRGNDRIIIPREAYDKAKGLPNKPAIRAHVAKAMTAVSADENVESFGLYRDFDKDTPPLILIPREEFDHVWAIEVADDPTRRFKVEAANIHVIKAVFQASNRKWEFVWNGVKISAPIEDPVFLADLLQRRYLIGNGDALKVDLKIGQRWDSTSSVWLNDSYTVLKVHSHVPAKPPTQLGLLDDDAL